MNATDLQQIDNLIIKRLKEQEVRLDKRFYELEKKVDNKIDDAVAHIIAVVDHSKADKSEVKSLEKRVTRVEKTFHIS